MTVYSITIMNKLREIKLMKTFFWSAYCHYERISAISEIQKIIARFGYILEFKKFSDISIVLTVEIEECKIDKLYSALKEYLSLNEFQKLDTLSDKECILFINTTFLKSTGDLRIEVPSVPG
jgi:hypothetical protein